LPKAIVPSKGSVFFECVIFVNVIGRRYAFFITYWSFRNSIKVFLIIKASFPEAVFDFSSHIAMASFNYFNGGISSTSFLVILTLGWNI